MGKGKGMVGSASSPNVLSASTDTPLVEAFAADAGPVDRTTNIHSQGGGISINVNINSGKADEFAGGGGFGGAVPMTQTHTRDGQIVEVARSPTHKKRRGNKTGKENISTEYTVEGGIDEVISTRRLVNIISSYVIFNDRLKSINMSIERFDEDIKIGFVDLYDKLDENLHQNSSTDESDVYENGL